MESAGLLLLFDKWSFFLYTVTQRSPLNFWKHRYCWVFEIPNHSYTLDPFLLLKNTGFFKIIVYSPVHMTEQRAYPKKQNEGSLPKVQTFVPKTQIPSSGL